MNSGLNKVVNINKPVGPTSFAMVQLVKRILGIKKAGHIGTLDPLAQGVLPICLNRSTRIVQFLSAQSKVYRAGMVLGVSTDSQDSTGKVLGSRDPKDITEKAVREVIESFVGQQEQIPPMFSAKKNKGIPLYKLARNGITIDRKPVSIHIHSIQFLKMEGNQVEFEARCSAGTYIRTLCHDIGEKLGCGAHMDKLVRTRVGVFDLDSALTPDELAEANANGSLADKLFPQEEALDFLPEVRIKEDFVSSITHGISIPKSSLETIPDQFMPGMNLRVSNGDNSLLAIVEPVVNNSDFALLEQSEVAFKLKRVLV
jgi:tRNA pseudouridine55 synthase